MGPTAFPLQPQIMSTPDTSDPEQIRLRVKVPKKSALHQALQGVESASSELLALAELGAIKKRAADLQTSTAALPSSLDVTAAILSIANSLQEIHQVLGQWAHAPIGTPVTPTTPAGSLTTPVTATAAREGGLLAAPVSTLLELENYGQ